MNGARKPGTSLSGTSVLVIEDEFYLAMDIKQEIERAGGNVLGPVPDTATSLAMIRRETPDCALVDINLGEGASFEVAEELKRKGIPFLFLTGYDAASIPPQMADVERFEKPTTAARIVAAVTRLAGR